MEQQLVACVQDSLALYLHDNARFMAERLQAEFPSEASWHIPPCTCASSSSDLKLQSMINPPAWLLAGQRAPAGNLLLQVRPGVPGIPPVGR